MNTQNSQPALDPQFQPAFLWNKTYRERVLQTGNARKIRVALMRDSNQISIFETFIFPDEPRYHGQNFTYLERCIKFLLWQRGAPLLRIEGAPELVPLLQKTYSQTGHRCFDAKVLGQGVFGQALIFEAQEHNQEPFPEPREPALSLGDHFNGCRVGFDLGGSDRKCAAVINGEVIFSEEITWDPYFQSDPQYHLAGIRDSIRRAAAKLPRIDAIGGSSAGIYVDNQVRVASLFRGVAQERFETEIRPLFLDLAGEFGVPFTVVNDGDVTALAGASALADSPVLGIAMGTSQAAGYVNVAGKITNWLNELAFAPIDFHPEAPLDEWSGDRGCGVQYFSQQAVARLIPKAGLSLPPNLKPAEQLVWLQERVPSGDPRVLSIYETIGTYLAYGLAHYATFYDLKHILLLGRVLSGQGGEILIQTCRTSLADIAPSLADTLRLTTPDENLKRHGQAVAAAGLVELPQLAKATP